MLLTIDVASFIFSWPFLVICTSNLHDQTVKIDMNIEKDLAYALKVKECPQVLFLRGNKILYREKGLSFFTWLISIYHIFVGANHSFGHKFRD